jgi:hypothetical protein
MFAWVSPTIIKNHSWIFTNNFLQLEKIEMQVSDYFYYPSHNWPFEAKAF